MARSKRVVMTKYQRAAQIWSILICAASEKKIYTYGKVAEILGYKGAGVFSQQLDPILFFCEQKGYPPLTSLIVGKKSGIPENEMLVSEELAREHKKVFDFEWFNILPPQIEDFIKADQA